MRLLHTSDWHVGKTIKGNSRIDEHRAVLTEIVGIAKQEDVDIVLGRQGGASENSIINMDVTASVNGIATLTRTLSPGAVVKPGVTLCVRAGRLGGLPAFPSPVQVYGFFAPDA